MCDFGIEPFHDLCGIACPGCCRWPLLERLTQSSKRIQRRMPGGFGTQKLQTLADARGIVLEQRVDEVVEQDDRSRVGEQIQLTFQ